VRLPGDPSRIRQYGVISALNFLRLRLLEDSPNEEPSRGEPQ
jgi:hypothetical protein